MLTDATIRSLTPKSALFRVRDRDGLWLEITPGGKKHWRYRYQWAGRERMISLGTYPIVTLALARDRCVDARRHLAVGRDPAQVKRGEKAAIVQREDNKFPEVARRWLQTRHFDRAQRSGDSKPFARKTYQKASTIIEGDLIPSLRHVAIADLTTPQAIAALDKIQGRAPHMAVKAKNYLEHIVIYAIQKGLRGEGKVLSLRGSVHTPEARSVPAAVTIEALAIVVKAIATYPSPVTKAALSFCSMTTMRPANVAEARWEHIDLKAATWTIPAEEMKSGKPHIVPLPTQALELLKQAESWRRRGGWVFPAQAEQDTPHLHRDTLSKALRELGLQGKHVPHGFRSSFRTIAREEWKIDIDVLEAQIAHAKQGQVNKAYDRTRFLRERVQVMQRWADLLEQLAR